MAFHAWKDLPLEVISPLHVRHPFKGKRLKIQLMTLQPWYIGEKHRHKCEQVYHILKGKLQVELGGEKRILREGEFAHFPDDLPHQAQTLDEETILLEISSPARYKKISCG